MLDVLNAAGHEVMYDCKRGECGLCAIDVVAVDGEIDHRDVFFSDHQKHENTKICACVSRARAPSRWIRCIGRMRCEVTASGHQPIS